MRQGDRIKLWIAEKVGDKIQPILADATVTKMRGRREATLADGTKIGISREDRGNYWNKVFFKMSEEEIAKVFETFDEQFGYISIYFIYIEPFYKSRRLNIPIQFKP